MHIIFLLTLFNKVAVHQLTVDHKTSHPRERRRLKKKGVPVSGGRVRNQLAMSRAFGDSHLKDSLFLFYFIYLLLFYFIFYFIFTFVLRGFCSEKRNHFSQNFINPIFFSENCRAGDVTCEPDISLVNPASHDQFLVIASDGLWDVMKNEEVTVFILRRIENQKGEWEEVRAWKDDCFF